jgi:hypothetical protein
MVQVRVVRDPSTKANGSIRIFLETIKMALLRCKMELPHSHGCRVGIVVTPQRDNPFKFTNKALVVLDTFDGKFLWSIKFRMIILVNWRSPFLRWGAKDGLALGNNALDVGLVSPCNCAIRVPAEDTTKMIDYLSNSLKLIASMSEFLKEEVMIGHTATQIINIDTNKLTVRATILHSNIRIDLARVESHVHKGISKEFMPSGSTGLNSIESLDNDE